MSENEHTFSNLSHDLLFNICCLLEIDLSENSFGYFVSYLFNWWFQTIFTTDTNDWDFWL